MRWNQDGKILCCDCRNRTAFYRRSCFCIGCYQKNWHRKKGNPQRNSYVAEQHESEILFSQKFPNMIYHPANFYLPGNKTKYSPDFYSPEKNIFYEVAGSRQAIFITKDKIEMVRKVFPKIKILVVNPDGTEYKFFPKIEEMPPPKEA